MIPLAYAWSYTSSFVLDEMNLFVLFKYFVLGLMLGFGKHRSLIQDWSSPLC